MKGIYNTELAISTRTAVVTDLNLKGIYNTELAISTRTAVVTHLNLKGIYNFTHGNVEF